MDEKYCLYDYSLTNEELVTHIMGITAQLQDSPAVLRRTTCANACRQMPELLIHNTNTYEY